METVGNQEKAGPEILPRARIVIADDNPVERQYLLSLLGHAGYEVWEAGDGKEALDRVRDCTPDLIISDILMPGLDGFELVRRLREQPDTALLRVIIWSATFRQQEAQRLSSALGVARFIVKPVEPQILLATVDAVLREPPPSPVPATVLGLLEEAHQQLLNDKLVTKMEELEKEIAAHRQVEIMLRESERRFSGLIAAATDAIISIDAGQRIVIFNAAAEAMFRCPAARAVGMPIEHFIPERFRAAHREYVRQFALSGTTSRTMGKAGAIWGRRAGGEEFPIEASISKVQVGGQWQLTVILRDITERRQAEEALRQQAMLLDLAPDPILVWESREGILFWNNACRELYGFSRQEALGKKSYELLNDHGGWHHP